MFVVAHVKLAIFRISFVVRQRDPQIPGFLFLEFPLDTQLEALVENSGQLILPFEIRGGISSGVGSTQHEPRRIDLSLQALKKILVFREAGNPKAHLPGKAQIFAGLECIGEVDVFAVINDGRYDPLKRIA